MRSLFKKKKKKPRVRKVAAFLGGKNAGEIMGCCMKVRECRNYRGQNQQRGNKIHELLEGSQSNSYQTAEERKVFSFTKIREPTRLSAAADSLLNGS